MNDLSVYINYQNSAHDIKNLEEKIQAFFEGLGFEWKNERITMSKGMNVMGFYFPNKVKKVAQGVLFEGELEDDPDGLDARFAQIMENS